MEPETFGAEQVTEEDRAYHGSRFSEVRDALFANPYQKLPVYKVTLGSVLRGLLPFGRRYHFLQAARRTVDSAADLRWAGEG
jgi:hypothetical protein